jgi:hypothetical protein
MSTILRTALVAVLATLPLAACSSTGAHPPVDAGTGAGGTGAGDAGPDAGPPDTTPITGLPAMTWTWVAFPGAICRDGSPAGLAVSMSPSSDRVMIFLQGGGTCVDPTTCSGNPASFDSSELDEGPTGGVFDRGRPENPVRDFSQVFVPYCTGDAFLGDAVGTIAGLGQQQYRGYRDLTLFLDRLVPTFPHASRVFLAGVSAGGVGAFGNYLHVAKAFHPVPVDLLDDSGPFFEGAYDTMPLSLVEALWGLDRTVLADCGTHCSDPSTYTIDAARYALSSYPEAAWGLAEAMNDSTTSAGDPDFAAGLLDIRMNLAPYPNFGTFYFQGTAHTTIWSDAFYTRTAGGQGGLDGGASDGGDAGAAVLMTDWVKSLVNGSASNVGP